MSAGFTPAPWRIDGLKANDGWGAYEDESSVEIACIPHGVFDALEIFGKRRDYDSYEEHTANARLIAAAPDLFEALSNAREWLAGFIANAGRNADEELAEADAALAKARGEADNA